MTFFARIQLFVLLLAALLLAAVAGPVSAQDVQTVEARASVLTPLSFAKETDLGFGQIIPGDADGTVVLDPNGTVTTTGGIVVRTGTQQPARFVGLSTFNERVLINIDQNSYLLIRDGGSESMLLDRVRIRFDTRPSLPIGTNARRFRVDNADGSFSFAIAGRLAVAADQAPGLYRSEFLVTLEYE